MKSYGSTLSLSKKYCSLGRTLSHKPIVMPLWLVNVLRYKRLRFPATLRIDDFFRLSKQGFSLDWSQLRLNEYSISHSEFHFLYFKTLPKYRGTIFYL